MFGVKRKPLKVLVTGGAGKTGSRVASRLISLGHSVRLASRSTTPSFDWEKPETWPTALSGADAVYAAYQPDVAVPGAADVVMAFAEQARRAGVRTFVLLSGRGEAGALRTEKLVRRAMPRATVVRASWFFQNFTEGFLRDAVVYGQIHLPANAVVEPFIDADDIADVAVEALVRRGHAGKTYEVTGPRSLSFDQVARILSDALGRPVVYTHTPVDAFCLEMRAQGVPDDVTQLLSMLFTEVLDGRNERPVNGVRKALGRAPRDFTDFARNAAASGIWDLPAEESADESPVPNKSGEHLPQV